MVNGSNFSKTICSICYEDLKPIVEDLQAISICGHVFHELCLQQWFEYCSGAKKQTCPVCKQKCSGPNANRLYFQSTGDSNDTVSSQKVTEHEDPLVLRGELKRLELKVSGLTSVVEQQEKDLKNQNEELCLCKEEVKKEVTLKNEALKQRASIQQLLHMKSEALDKSTLECLRLQDRNMALAKELAALKLVSDLNLEEDEVFKLASFGNESHSKDTVDVLRRSLVTRNKSYKELLAKCNLLGRGEARFCKKLEKAKEKINKLKTRVQELERVVESRDNVVLRALKASEKSRKGNDSYDSNICVHDVSPENQTKEHSIAKFRDDRTDSLTNCYGKTDNTTVQNVTSSSSGKAKPFQSLNKEMDADLSIIEDASEFLNAVERTTNSSPNLKINEDIGDQKSCLLRPVAASNIHEEVSVLHVPSKLVEPFESRTHSDSDTIKVPATAMDENVAMLPDSITECPSILNIRKESSALPLPSPGDVCFTGGLLGPDGTNRYLGKWCKRGQNKGTDTMHGSSMSSNLIAIGADGRGGRVKVLRSINQSSLMEKESSTSAKRSKHGTKTSNMQSQGCLQIEHFFGRVGNN